MSDTPRTDAKRFEMISDLQSGYRYVVSADFAMQLERELTEAKIILRDVVDHAPCSDPDCCDMAMTCEAARQRAKKFIETISVDTLRSQA